MPRGGRRSNPGGRPRSPDPRSAFPVYLTRSEKMAVSANCEPAESVQDFAREALASLPRTRRAVAEIEDMIRGCNHTLSTAHGNLRMMTDRQLRTLEFVLALLKEPAARRRQDSL